MTVTVTGNRDCDIEIDRDRDRDRDRDIEIPRQGLATVCAWQCSSNDTQRASAVLTTQNALRLVSCSSMKVSDGHRHVTQMFARESSKVF
jgi:hypothetical protein